MTKFFILIFSHGLVLAPGFALGIYALPILIGPAAPTKAGLAPTTTCTCHRSWLKPRPILNA